MPIDGDTYKRIGQAAAGAVSVVATRDPGSGTIVALTVSSFVTLSFDPPLVMFAIQQKADSFAAMMASKSFGVSLLNVSQEPIARICASKGSEKTSRVSFEDGATLQVPLVGAALAQIECTTKEILISGDHAIVVGLVEGAVTTPSQPLLYFAREYGAFSALKR